MTQIKHTRRYPRKDAPQFADADMAVWTLLRCPYCDHPRPPVLWACPPCLWRRSATQRQRIIGALHHDN